MTPSKRNTHTDGLALFARCPEPRRSSVMVALADPETRAIMADHLERLGYGVWTARSGLDAYRACLTYHEGTDVLVCDENLPDLPPLVLYGRLKTHLPGLQCCVLASVTHRDSQAGSGRPETVVLDVIGWRAGMLFVNAVVTAEPARSSG